MSSLALRVLALGSLLFLPTRSARAQLGTDRAERISASLEYSLVLGDVESFALSGNGLWVAYRAQQDEAILGLYVAPTDGSAAAVRVSPSGVVVDDVRVNENGGRIVYAAGGRLYRVGPSGISFALTPALAPSGRLGSFEISPDGQRVLYLSDAAGDGLDELYSVNLFGAANPLRVSDPSVAPGHAVAFQFTPDGTQVVFRAYAGSSPPIELYTAPVDASALPLHLSGPGSGVMLDVSEPGVLVSPDSSRVVYRQLHAGKVQLYSVPLDASSAPVRLNDTLVAGGNVTSFRISADGSRVAYLADQEVNDREELYSVSIDGLTPPLKLNGTEVDLPRMAVSPDGALVAYVGSPGGNGYEQVYVAPMDGSLASVQVSDRPTSGFRQSIPELAFTLDSASVLYRAGNQPQLYRAPADGLAAPVQLNAPVVSQGSVTGFTLASGGNRLLYRGETLPSTFEYFTMTLDGSQAPTRVHAALAPGSQASGLQLAAGRALFLADLDARSAFELHAAPLDAGGPAVKLNGPLQTSSGQAPINAFAVGPDGTHVAYATGAGVYSVDLTALGSARALTPASSELAGYQDLRFAPDSSRVTFRGFTLGTHLFSAPTTGPGLALQLTSGGFAYPFGVSSYVTSPDGSHLIFGVSTYDGPGGTYVVPADGSLAPASFSSAFFAQVFLTSSPRVAYLSTFYNPFVPQPTRLFVRDVDASTPAVELAAFPAFDLKTTLDFALSPDQSRIVFLRDEEAPDKYELYSVPFSGGAFTKLSDPLDADRDVSKFLLTPDGTRAVYVADRDDNNVFELYVVPIDGSAAPLELSGPMVAGGDVVSAGGAQGERPLVWFTPDSTRVLYAADQELNDRFDLWSVPLDGSAAPVRLTQLVTGGDLDLDPGAVRLDAGGTRAVYRADALQDERFELFSVPVDGSAPALPISGPLGTDQDVESGFLLLASPPAVLYRADGAVNNRIELWLAPLDGHSAPTRRSTLEHAAADVEPGFQLSPDGAFVYYLADALVDGRLELFRFPIERHPRAKTR